MLTKLSTYSLMSKMMTITIMNIRAMKKVEMNFFIMYQSIFLSPSIFN